MKTLNGHLTYCSNIHTGEDWQHHFLVLQNSIPVIKQQVSPNSPMGIGLRLANQASIDLSQKENLEAFKNWLSEQNCYVFTMNGFPYGDFHDAVVKDQVHAPDWTTTNRRDYTIRMFEILADILPNDMQEGGISTSPLSYRYWWETPEKLAEAIAISTTHILQVVEKLAEIQQATGKVLHLDIEPEPDGILENSAEFIDWYQHILLPSAKEYFKDKNLTDKQIEELIHTHVQLCYDICHFAVNYEKPEEALAKLEQLGIKIGKFQVSSAIRVVFDEQKAEKLAALAQYNEPTYLHQVVALKEDGSFEKFTDLGDALNAAQTVSYQEWRVHFHVPLFIEHYGLLSSTRNDIGETLALHKQKPATNHLEIETYTWGVLPAEVQAPLNDSIVREIAWVKTLV